MSTKFRFAPKADIPRFARCYQANSLSLLAAAANFAEISRLPLHAIGAMEMPIAISAREPQMMDFRDLFQWDRFITPTIVKTFYWLLVMLLVLFGLSGVFFGLTTMAVSPFGGFLIVLTSIFSVIVGVVFSRMLAEFCLMIFRISEHLDAIRKQGTRELIHRERDGL